jgi:hypothetical protein
MTTLTEKIAAARAALEEATPTDIPVVLGEHVVTVAMRPIPGADWANLIATNPPRTASVVDNNIGYNLDGCLTDYPLDHVTIDGQPIDRDTWTELLDALPSPSRRDLGSTAWGLNDWEPRQRLQAALDQAATP